MSDALKDSVYQPARTAGRVLALGGVLFPEELFPVAFGCPVPLFAVVFGWVEVELLGGLKGCVPVGGSVEFVFDATAFGSATGGRSAGVFADT